MCFQSYLAKRSQSILEEYTLIVGEMSGSPSAIQGHGHGKLIIWLPPKLMGLPVPATSAEITDRYFQENMISYPSDPVFNTDRDLKEWNTAWADASVQTIPGVSMKELLHFLVAELLNIGVGDRCATGPYYCLCSNEWLAREQMRHCWGCHECKTKDSLAFRAVQYMHYWNHSAVL
jgi:hypothetical protein